MKIAITGARGTLGRLCVAECNKQGHDTIEINRSDEPADEKNKQTEHRTADAANSYEDIVKAFKGADAVIHLGSVPNPVDKDDHYVHNNNTNSNYNALRAAAELKIKRFAFISSVNATGLVYSESPIQIDYLPIDEEHPSYPSDSYAMAKIECELQCTGIARQFPFMNIASLRIHEIAPKTDCAKEHADDPENGVRQMWGWVNPQATARACLLAVTTDKIKGHEVFNIVGPDTTQKTPSEELAQKHYPNAQIKGDLSGNKSFWNSSKAQRVLGWTHPETE